MNYDDDYIIESNNRSYSSNNYDFIESLGNYENDKSKVIVIPEFIEKLHRALLFTKNNEENEYNSNLHYSSYHLRVLIGFITECYNEKMKENDFVLPINDLTVLYIEVFFYYLIVLCRKAIISCSL